MIFSKPRFAAATLIFLSTGCAHGTTQKHPDQIIKADPHVHDPLTALEQELGKVHSERVIVSTALLKSLVRNERLRQNQCKNISGQLEAIKNVDLEETGETGPEKEGSQP